MNFFETVYIIDDKEEIKESLQELFISMKQNVHGFNDAQSFLNYYKGQKGCLVLDVRLPGMSGLQLQDKLRKQYPGLPVIFITGHADVSMAVECMKVGAFDFLEKPFKNQELLDSVFNALTIVRQNHSSKEVSIHKQYSKMTKREKQIFDFLLQGENSKCIAKKLYISIHTVEVHRTNILKKTNFPSIAKLIGSCFLERRDGK